MAFNESLTYGQRLTTSTTFPKYGPMASSCIIDVVAPSVDDWLAIDIGDKGHQAFPEFGFGADADMAQPTSTCRRRIQNVGSRGTKQ